MLVKVGAASCAAESSGKCATAAVFAVTLFLSLLPIFLLILLLTLMKVFPKFASVVQCVLFLLTSVIVV